MSHNIDATGTAHGPAGSVGWSFSFSIQDGGGNGEYGTLNELIDNHPEEFIDLIKQFAVDQLNNDFGVTSVSWSYEQVTRPSLDILHHVP